MAAANHLLRNVTSIDEALRHDSFVVRRSGSTVARCAIADLDALYFFAGDKCGHLRRRFGAARMSCLWTINSAESNMQINSIAIDNRSRTLVVSRISCGQE